MLQDGKAHHRATSLLSAAEQRVLGEWQGADAPVSGALVHELLRERAALWPDAVAIESASGDEQLTFAQLDARSEALARRLVAAGARRGDVIGLHLRPGVTAIAAVWAVWKAGGAFLPLDPELPPARLELMLDDTTPSVIVSQDASTVPGSRPVVSPNVDDSAVAQLADVTLPKAEAHDLAYIMYTSGSTGRPKGVMIDHGGIANYAEAMLLPRIRSGGIEAGQHVRILAGTSAFISDFFLEQILPMLDGHRLLALSGVEARDPRHPTAATSTARRSTCAST